MKILLDMGHTLSGADTGAEGCGRREQDCTREIGYKVKAKLEALGHAVVVCNPDGCTSLDQSLRYRVDTANNADGDIFVSMHLNAFNGDAYGVEIYTYGAKAFNEAENVLNNLVGLGYANRGIKDGSRLYVIKNTVMKAMLIECGFIDNVGDMERYNDDKIADAIVSGLVGSTVETNPEENRPSGDDWIRRVQSECNRQGFSNQTVDGYPGPVTLAGCPLVRYGATGNITKLIQERLNKLGYNTNGIDGMFYGGTRYAVTKFQIDNGLSADGIVGRDTWRVLLGL